MTVGRPGDGRERPQGDCQPAARLNARPAPTTWAACSRPGCRVNRSRGPETDTAATTVPSAANTGADTDATPVSRSATLSAQPQRGTVVNVEAENFAALTSRSVSSGGSHASSTCAAEPAVMGSSEPTGTVSRSPLDRSAATTQCRTSPDRR